MYNDYSGQVSTNSKLLPYCLRKALCLYHRSTTPRLTKVLGNQVKKTKRMRNCEWLRAKDLVFWVICRLWIGPLVRTEDEGEVLMSLVTYGGALSLYICIHRQCCRSAMIISDPIFSHSRSRVRIFSIPDPGSASKNWSILTQKLVSKLSEIWSGLFRIGIRDPNPDFLRIPDPRSRGQKGTGSRIRICNTLHRYAQQISGS